MSFTAQHHNASCGTSTSTFINDQKNTLQYRLYVLYVRTNLGEPVFHGWLTATK